MNMKNLNLIFAFIYFASLVLSSPIRLTEESALEDAAVASNDEVYVVSSLEDCESNDEVEIKGTEYVVDDEEDCLSGDEIVNESDKKPVVPAEDAAAGKEPTDEAKDEYVVSNAEDCE
eukprot:jgi/Orpsp1_1/1191016/evm.model.d7180000082895.1